MYQERMLPESSQELYLAWVVWGRSFAAVARDYGSNESAVRKRVHAFIERRISESLPSGI